MKISYTNEIQMVISESSLSDSIHVTMSHDKLNVGYISIYYKELSFEHKFPIICLSIVHFIKNSSSIFISQKILKNSQKDHEDILIKIIDAISEALWEMESNE